MDSCRIMDGEGEWNRLCINSRPVFIPTHGLKQASSSIWHNLRALNANPACVIQLPPQHVPGSWNAYWESHFFGSGHWLQRISVKIHRLEDKHINLLAPVEGGNLGQPAGSCGRGLSFSVEEDGVQKQRKVWGWFHSLCFFNPRSLGIIIHSSKILMETMSSGTKMERSHSSGCKNTNFLCFCWIDTRCLQLQLW